MGFFNFDNNYINQLAKDLILSQDYHDGMQNRDKLVEKGERGAEVLLKVLNREKDNPSINWYYVLTTLDYIGGESEELVLKGVSIYQQSNSKKIHIYDLFSVYGNYGLELTKFAHRELVKIGNSNFDNFLKEIMAYINMLLKDESYSGVPDLSFFDVFSEFKNDKMIRFLTNLLKNTELINFDDRLIDLIFLEIWSIGTQAVPAITNLLFDSNEEIRKEAAVTLGLIADSRAVRALAQALCNDTSEEVKNCASEALAKIGFPAVNTLLMVIKDQNPVVRELGAKALGEIGDRQALQPLTRLLSDIDLEVQKEANIAIEKICKTHNLNPQQFTLQSQSKNKGITEIKDIHPNRVNDPVQRLKKVKELLDMGAITKEEFERKKKQLLDKI